MNILISNTSNQPIYEQIYMQLRDCIVSGELTAGDALPSIRALAKELRISVITTKRAYDELEHDGYIYTVGGKGCYVAEKNIEMIREGRLREIEEHMRQIVQLSRTCHLTDGELREMFRVILEEDPFE